MQAVTATAAESSSGVRIKAARAQAWATLGWRRRRFFVTGGATVTSSCGGEWWITTARQTSKQAEVFEDDGRVGVQDGSQNLTHKVYLLFPVHLDGTLQNVSLNPCKKRRNIFQQLLLSR